MQERRGAGPAPRPPRARTRPTQAEGRPVDDERERWLEENAARLHEVLADPAVSAEVLGLLGMDDEGRRRERRLAQVRRELASIELRLKLAEDEVWEP